MVDDHDIGIHLYAQVVLTHPFQQFGIRPFRDFPSMAAASESGIFFNVCNLTP